MVVKVSTKRVIPAKDPFDLKFTCVVDLVLWYRFRDWGSPYCGLTRCLGSTVGWKVFVLRFWNSRFRGLPCLMLELTILACSASWIKLARAKSLLTCVDKQIETSCHVTAHDEGGCPSLIG